LRQGEKGGEADKVVVKIEVRWRDYTLDVDKFFFKDGRYQKEAGRSKA
jgi:hypothetical protein